jgi:GNAT superfamily N-acetyltransferase
LPEVSLAPPASADSAELGRICYDAFKDISERHGFQSDFRNPEIPPMFISALIANEQVYGVAASLDGRLAGSNFVAVMDEVGGLGPITVDPPAQGNGIGRKMMEDALRHAGDTGVEQVRLCQDAFNVTSMSLYSSVGFDTVEPLGLLDLQPAEAPDDSVRVLTADDMPAVGALCRDIYKVSRANEILGAPRFAVQPLVRERSGRLRGYVVPGLIGHGVAETEDDMLVLLAQAARLSPVPASQLVPLTEGSLFRKALAHGHRLRKMMNLMVYGPYEAPDGVWVPSVLY